MQTGPKGVPFLVTHDARTIRYPDPLIKVNDTIQLEIATGKILDFIKFEAGMYVVCVCVCVYIEYCSLIFV